MEAVIEQRINKDGSKYTMLGESLLMVDLWERQLRGGGAIGWVDEHCEFRPVPCGRWALDRFSADRSQQPVVLPRMTPELLMENLRVRSK